MSLDRDSALSRFAAAPVARLATIDGAGNPHLVPVTFAVDSGFVFTMVDHKPKSTQRLRRIENVRVNPRVTLLADHYEDDWSRLWWVRIDGAASVVSSGGHWERGRELLADKYGQYRHRPPEGPAIVIQVGNVISWSP